MMGWRMGEGLAQDEGNRLQLVDAPTGPLGAFVVHNGVAYGVQGKLLFKLPLRGPDAYTIIAQIPLGAAAIDVLYDDADRVLVLTDAGVYMFDAATLTLLDIVLVGGTTLDVQGDQWVLASRQQGVRLYGDEMLQLLLAGEALDAKWLADGQIAVADQFYGLQIVADQAVSRPLRIAAAQQLVTDGTYLYALDGHRVIALDMSVSTQPQIIGSYSPIHAPLTVATIGAWVVVADAADGLKIYDNQLHYIGSQTDQPALQVAIDPTERWLVSGQSGQLDIYDARQLPDLALEATIPLWADPDRVRFTGDGLALAIMRAGGIGVIDLARGEVVSALPFSGPVVDVLPLTTRIWAVLQANGRLLLLEYDRRNNGIIQVYADLDVAGQPSLLAREDNYLLAATGRAGLQIFDISDATAPTLIQSLPAHSAIHAVQVTADGWLLQDGSQLRLYQPVTDTWIVEQTLIDLRSIHVAPNAVYSITGTTIQRWNLADSEFQLQATYAAPIRFVDAVAQDNGLLLATDGGAIWLDTTIPQRPQEHVLTIDDEIMAVSHVSLHGDDVLIGNREQLVHFRRSQTTDADFVEVGRFRLENASATLAEVELSPDITRQILTAITASTTIGDALWIGTANGQLWQADSTENRVTLRGQGFGGPIFHITTGPNPLELLLSMGDGGLLWFDMGSDEVMRRSDVSAYAAVADPTGEWVAVARGNCGLQIYAAADMQLVASDQAGVVSDVRWTDTIRVVVDGFTATYAFAPNQPMRQAPILLQPSVATSNALRWSSSSTGCVEVEYEVWMNEEQIGTTTDTFWPLIGLQDQQLSWHVVAIDAFGNRSTSGSWLAEGNAVGWLSRPQQYQAMTVSVEEAQFPFWIFGVGLMLLGVIGLRLLVPFWRI